MADHRYCWGCANLLVGIAMVRYDEQDQVRLPVLQMDCGADCLPIATLLNPSAGTLRDATSRAANCAEFRGAV